MSHSASYIRLINCTTWRDIRSRFLAKHPLCERCLEKHHVRPAQCVHHRVPIESVPESQQQRIAYAESNLQALCYRCHHDIHADLQSTNRAGHQRAQAVRLEDWKRRAMGDISTEKKK